MVSRRKRLASCLALALLASAFGAEARAEIDAANFLRAFDESQPSARAYIMGVGTGVASANLAARKATGRFLYCAPSVDISAEEQIEILRIYLRQAPEEADAAVSDALLSGLTRFYPCPVQ